MANPQHEPTMEEILASIRKIISDDASTAAAASAASPPEHATSEPEVFDLTQEIRETSAVAATASSAAEGEPMESHPAGKNETIVESAEAAPTSEPASSIFSDKTRQALSDALSGIHPEAPDASAETHAETTVPAVADASIEAVFERAVREAFDPVVQRWLADNADTIVERMKPLIRDWLDENFPALLEEAVHAELARATRPRGRR
jgi:uncharacterized protein